MFLVVSLLAAWITVASAESDRYQVQAGDLLQVSVWKEPDLLREVLVRPDGGFTFPLTGELVAKGRAVDEIREEITEKLKRYIPEPVVTVEVRQILGNKIYVVGKVNRPGEFVVNPRIDVIQALSIAGGMTPYAALKDIKILRRGANGSTAIPFNYVEIENGEHLENIMLESGDTVIVP